jgi:hypothetical protein
MLSTRDSVGDRATRRPTDDVSARPDARRAHRREDRAAVRR